MERIGASARSGHLWVMRLVIAWLSLFMLAACRTESVRPSGAGGSVGDITLRDWRATNSVGLAGATLFGIIESGGVIDTLSSVRSDGAAETMLHFSEQSGGMRAAGAFLVSPNASVTLRDRGPHAMMRTLSRTLEPGDSITVTLHFQQSGELTLRVPVFRLTEAATELP